MQREKKEVAPTLDGRKARIGLVVARFNSDITSELLKNAQVALRAAGVKEKNVHVVSVAGAVELPLALQRLAKTKKFDCLIALACVIRGDTPHFDYVCKMAQEGVLRVSLDHSLPIGFGVITVNNLDQALVRFHVGGEAALAALELTKLHVK